MVVGFMFSKSQLKWYLTLFLPAFIFYLISATNPSAALPNTAFSPGEKLTFKLRWGFIPAGSAVLEVLPIEIIGGIKSYHFVMKARTNAFIDAFYKYRSRIDAYADVGMTGSILYRKKVEVRKKIKEVVVNFDWDKNVAQYHRVKKEFITYSKDPEEKKPKARIRTENALISILPGSFDPLSAFYYSRLIQLNENTSFQRPVTDGEKCVIGYAKVKKREKIKMSSGMYDTYLIEPDMKHIEGVFEKSKNAKIKLWVTADKRRIPVKLKSKVVVGSFTGELVSAASGKN